MAGQEKVTTPKERNDGGIRITTWNVNGIRNPFGYQPWRDNRTFAAMFDILDTDIIIMQELKIQRKDLRDDMVLVDGWDCFFSLPRHKKGYSGVGIYTRQSVCAPIKAEEGILGVLSPSGINTRYCDLPQEESIGGYPSVEQLEDIGVDPVQLDSEGRCVALEFPAFVLFGVYSPANSNGLRDDYRRGFLKALDARIRNLNAIGKRVILTGDLNVSRDEKDSACAEEDNRKTGTTHEEYVSSPNRRIFNQLIDGGAVYGPRDTNREEPMLLDLCREFHPSRERMFTHWEQKINARPGNYGSRIDHILPSISMRSWFSDANIQEGLLGSDHCPVYAVLRPLVRINDQDVHLRDIMNPPNIFKDGQRLVPITAKHFLPNSGKLLPEFTKRQNIKDMFKRTVSNGSTLSAIQSQSRDFPGLNPPSTLASTGLINGDNKRDASAFMESPPKKKQKNTPKDIKAGVVSQQTSQQSLKSFFQPKQTAQEVKSLNATIPTPISPEKTSNTTTSRSPSVASVEEKFIDPFVTKTEWTKLFSKRDAPRCEGHSEPCQRLQTKVKGPNCGRWFWICSRPVGPSGKKEHNTQWRCGTFIWASDLGKD